MDKSEKFWDKIAVKYDKTEKRFEDINLKVHEYTKKYLNKDDVLLDFGCATGAKALKLAAFVKQIHGIDISNKMIEGAKKNAALQKTENVEFVKTTIFDERYKRDSFDVILAFNMLHGLEDIQKVMQRISELLKPGSLFISITPCMREKMSLVSNLQLPFFRLLIKLGLLPNVLRRYKFSELENLITNANLQVIESENLYNWMSNYFVVAKKQ